MLIKKIYFLGEAKEQRLQEAEVTVLSQEECEKKYADVKGGTVIDEKMLCAWADGKDACQVQQLNITEIYDKVSLLSSEY